jgi:site-specific DNA-methyltransferase (adenine-specific)
MTKHIKILNCGFKILNVITWEKSNPPPNFSCRYFTYSTEQIIWARKSEKVPHYYNYELMKQLNGDKQMKDVWKLPAIAPWEKSCGKHPTQKPLSVLTRLILASTKPNAWILDPFAGSSTTGISANLANRRFLGIDQEEEFLTISRNRKLKIEDSAVANNYRKKIAGFIDNRQLGKYLIKEAKVEAVKTVLGYCRAKDLKQLIAGNTFYFHAVEGDKKVLDFETGIVDARRLILYSGGRSKRLHFTGYYGVVSSVHLKHKSEIKGKEDSETSFYYEVVLEDGYHFDKDFAFELEVKRHTEDSVKAANLLRQYLPVLTTWERVIGNR